jgi:scyllo-inositol 2-dehydrogenase (NADP+)
MTTLSALRVAVVGYGLAGSVFHAPLVAATPGLKLATILTRDTERAAVAGAQHPQATVVADMEALWASAPDLLVIAAPNRHHHPLALQALRRGIAVVVDKPLAVTAADAAELIDVARAQGVMLSVFQNRRWDGDFLTVQQLIGSAQLGSVRRFESRFERWRPEPRPGWRQHADPRDGGGVLLDLGSHLIDQALQLFGPVRSLYAELEHCHPDTQVEDDAFIALEHASGVRAHLWMSSMAAQAGPRFRVLGSRGAYLKHGLDGQEAALRSGMRADDPGFGQEAESDWGSLIRGDEAENVPTLPGQWTRYYVGIERALRTGASAPVTAEDALQVLQLMEMARRSAAERCVMRVDAM